MIFFDAQHHRLALFKKQATPEFWDAQWQQEALMRNISSEKTYHFLKGITAKYVNTGGKIIEGGCGTGQVVYCLDKWGYEAYGIDFAENTIKTVSSLFPHLRLSVQDVRRTNFADATFDGYWSLGVIEHFWDGYDEIIQEAARVLKPGGTLFLTFPWMSPLRKQKARLGRYPALNTNVDPATFYEFMLDEKQVMERLKRFGFACMETLPYDTMKGLKDEFGFLHGPLQKIYDSRSPIAKGVRGLLTLLFGRLAGHMILLVCKKQSLN